MVEFMKIIGNNVEKYQSKAFSELRAFVLILIYVRINIYLFEFSIKFLNKNII